MTRLPNIIPSILIAFLIVIVSLMQSCNGSEISMSDELRECQSKADSLMKQGDYQNAMKIYIDVLKIAEKTGNDTTLAKALGKIGTIYAYHDDYHKAFAYYERSLVVSSQCGDTLRMVNIISNLIMINKVLGNKTKEEYYTKMFNDFKVSGNIHYDFNLLYIKFLNSLENGQDKEAKNILAEMLAFIDENNYGDNNKAMLYNHLGRRFVEREEYDSALNYYRRAAGILDTTQFFNNRQALYNNMCALFNQLGERDSLTFYRGKMYESSDSVFNLRNFNNAKDRLDSYEQEITEHKIRSFKKRAYWTLGIGAFILIILIISVFYSKKINRARLVMVRLNETLLNENSRLRKEVEAFSAIREQESIVQPVGKVEDVVKKELEDKNTAEPEGEDTAKKPIISDELMKRLSTEILDIMNDRKSVFNPDYNLNMLALQLNTNTRYVSEVIRHLGYSNFRNFINEFRIREACQRLSDNDHYGHLTIGAIAEGVGFNSDNSFIIAFKKIMGMTPAKYRRLASDVKKKNTDDVLT